MPQYFQSSSHNNCLDTVDLWTGDGDHDLNCHGHSVGTLFSSEALRIADAVSFALAVGMTFWQWLSC